MADFRSLNIPTTRQIMRTGGGIRVREPSVLDISHNDHFIPSFDTGLWTEDGANANVTKVNGSPMRLDIDASGGPAQFLLNGSVPNEGPCNIDVGYAIDHSTTLVGDCIVFRLSSLSGGVTFFTLDVIRDEDSPDIRIDINYRDSTMGAAALSTTSFNKLKSNLRLVFTPDDNFYLIDRDTNTVLDSFAFVLDWAPSWTTGVFFPSNAANVASVVLYPIVFGPVVGGVPCDNDTGFPELRSYGDSFAIFSVDASFPGSFPLTLYGVGAFAGTSESIGTLEVLPSSNVEDSVKLVVSPVEQFYDDASEVLACRNFALEPTTNQRAAGVQNRGDLSVPMMCVCDGTAEDGSKVDIIAASTGRLDEFDNRIQNPEFYLRDLVDPEDESTWKNYGTSFHFDKIPDLTESLLTDSLRNLRCLKLDNGDRFYYGVLYTPFATDQDYHFTKTGGPNDDWTLVRINDDNTESVVDSGIDQTAFPLTQSLTPGRYRLDIAPTGINNMDIKIYQGTSTADPLIISYQDNSNDEDYGIFFEVKPSRGKFVYFVYDRCNNLWTKYESGVTDVSLRTDSFSAIQLDSETVVLLYENMPDDSLFDNLTTRLSYRRVTLSSGALGSRSEIGLPRNLPTDGKDWIDTDLSDSFQWVINCFDVVKTNNTLNIMLGAELASDLAEYPADSGELVGIKPRFYPMLDTGLINIVVDANVISFDSTDHELFNYDVRKIPALSLERMFRFRAPDKIKNAVLTFGPMHVSRICADYVKCEYDEDRDLVVLSMIDRNHRAPLIIAGKDFVYKEIGIPHHFRIADYLYLDTVLASPLGYSDFDWFGLESLHAVFGYDGMIYSVATTPGKTVEIDLTGVPTLLDEYSVEVGVMDPQLFYSEREYYIKYDTSDSEDPANFEDSSLDIYAPEFRFESTPVANIYQGASSPATGSLLAPLPVAITDGQIFTLTDGLGPPQIFEFDKLPDGVTTPGAVAVDISAAASDVAVATAMVSAINGSVLRLTASNVGGTSATVTIINDADGKHGNVNNWTTDTVMVITQPSGGDFFTAIRSASLMRQNQYLVMPCGTDEIGFPIIFQAFEYDTIPFSTQEEEIWQPIFAGNSQWVKEASATYENGYLQRITGASVFETTLFERILTGTTVPEDRHENSDVGYKFHARVAAASESLSFPFNPTSSNDMSLYFNVSARRDDDGINRESRARMQLVGGTINCQVYNPDTAAFVTVNSFTGAYSPLQIVDLYMIVRNRNKNKFNVFFAYKIRHENIAATPVSEYQFVFKSDGDFFVSTGLTDVPGDTETQMSLSYQKATVLSDNHYRVYQMGWNTLTARKGSIFFEGGKGFDIPPTDGRSPGRSWQSLDDAVLFDHKEGVPDFNFKPDKLSNRQRTVWLHWPNGFEYSYAGNRAVLRDSWELSRELLNNTSSLPTKKFHGFWYTLNDDTDVVIWADSFDSGLDKFEVDAFMVDGGNLPSYTIVGKDNLIDPWTELGTIDMTRHNVSGVVTTDLGEVQIANVASAGFNLSTFNEFDYYYADYTGSIGPGTVVLRVLDNSDTKLYLEPKTGQVLAQTTGKIFSSRGSKILDSRVRYRFIGIRLSALDTFEGRFQLKSFDFGLAREIPLADNHALSSNINFQAKGKIRFVHDDLGFPTNEKGLSKAFDLRYTTMDALTFIKYKAILDKVTFNRRIIWVIEHYLRNREHVYMCLASKPVSQNTIIDEDGDRIYSLDVELKSIK